MGENQFTPGGSSAVPGIWDHLAPGTPRPTVSVIVPAMNEAKNLPHVAARMPPDVDEIVVVDGHSVDDTVAVGRALWPDAVHVTQTRKGKGNALACGFAASSGEIIVMIDADGSTDPQEISRYVAALVNGADYAKGSRFVAGGGSADITRVRRAGNWGLNLVVNTLFSCRFTDLCYGYNAFWRRCLGVMQLPSTAETDPQWGDGFEIETLINVRIAVSGQRITEVHSFEANRIHGESNLNAVRDGLRVLRTIRQEFAHQRRSGRSVTPIRIDVPAAPAEPVQSGDSGWARSRHVS
ncbi:glycosyltransferase family 2 protein [Gordonia sp. NPDC057258]|uniref:glycosyltransferase family 2 protein n=1 Tax=unclassified Gordonia (in: high G+C Gram-positive bacteria) TaxID=2657482 RepID=UPI003630A441